MTTDNVNNTMDIAFLILITRIVFAYWIAFLDYVSSVFVRVEHDGIKPYDIARLRLTWQSRNARVYRQWVLNVPVFEQYCLVCLFAKLFFLNTLLRVGTFKMCTMWPWKQYGFQNLYIIQDIFFQIILKRFTISHN